MEASKLSASAVPIGIQFISLPEEAAFPRVALVRRPETPVFHLYALDFVML
jgi:hypothetical protein